jgi:hypothetical protein
MLINFLDFKLEPKVHYDCVTEHKPENLISRDIEQLTQGFMAYSVTKPPVELEFELIALIQVHSIKIWAQLGSLQSTGFELWAKRDSTETYQKVRHAYLEPEHIGVLFIHKSVYEPVPNNFLTVEFVRSSFHILSACKFVKIIIKRTKSCAPVLKKIQIWGHPSRASSKKEQTMIISKWTPFNVTKELSPTKSVVHLEVAESQSTPDLDIPEDFLDALTYNIMTLPMTLPSGKIIDQTTLEKHNQHEETWGRPPSDPFTWTQYRISHKPMLDLALKARIDLFLLQNSNNSKVKALPRTTGRLRTSTPQQRIVSYTTTTTDDNNPSKKVKLDVPTVPAIDLNSAVQMALAKITRFSKPTVSNIRITGTKCEKCSKIADYRISTCKHLLCKGCLISLGISLSCFQCNKIFNKADIERYHT